MSFCFQIKQARIIPHSLNMDKNTLDTGLHTTIINLWKTNMNSFWTVFWLQEKKSTFCLPTLFFFPPAEIWHWIVFFLIFCDTSKRGCPSFCHTVSRRECFNSSVLWAEEPDGKFCLASAAEGQAHLLTWLGNFWCDAPIYLSRISIAFTSISLRDFRSSIGTLRILHFLQCFLFVPQCSGNPTPTPELSSRSPLAETLW